MSPSGNRRDYLLAAGALLGGTSIAVGAGAVVSDVGRGMPYESSGGGTVKTEEAVVSDIDISLDSASRDSYAALIRTQKEAEERYRVAYLRDECNIDISSLVDVNYETEFLAVVGYILPKKRNLSLDDDAYEDGTLRASYEITDSDGLNDPRIHHNVTIYRQKHHEPPAKIEAEFSKSF